MYNKRLGEVASENRELLEVGSDKKSDFLSDETNRENMDNNGGRGRGKLKFNFRYFFAILAVMILYLLSIPVIITAAVVIVGKVWLMTDITFFTMVVVAFVSYVLLDYVNRWISNNIKRHRVFYREQKKEPSNKKGNEESYEKEEESTFFTEEMDRNKK